MASTILPFAAHFPCSTAPQAFPRPDRRMLTPARAGRVKAGRSSAATVRLGLDTTEHDGSYLLSGCGMTNDPRGARHRAHSLRRNLVFGRIFPDPDHDAVIRIGGEAPGGGPILESGVERHGLLRVAATSDRDQNRRRVRQAPKACRIPPCYAARITTPAGTSPTVTRRHRAMRSFRASATIMVLRVPRRAFAVRTRYHSAKALSFWNLRKRQAS